MRQKTQALIRQWWNQIGIETELINHDASVFFGGDPQQPRYVPEVLYGPADVHDRPKHRSAAAPVKLALQPDSGAGDSWGGGNIFRGCDAEYDVLFEQLTQTPVGAEREALVKQLNDINVQSNFQIALVHRGTVSAHLDTLQGVWINGWDSEMWNIAEWHR